MIIFEAIGIILFVLFVAVAINTYNDCAKTDRAVMSFREAIDLTGLPVVTFLIGDKKCNFLLDTGANMSCINKDILNTIKYEDTGERSTAYGIDGIEREVKFVEINLVYGDRSYSDTFQATEMSEAFNKLKNDTGVSVVGILGNSFFQAYQYVIDFEKLIVYPKK